MDSKIIVALDNMKWKDAIELADKLEGHVWGYKLNDALHDRACNLSYITAHGNLMLDPKLYDIPSTVANTVKKLAERAGDAETLITVHASAGVAAMTEAVKASPPNVKILAITALTSFTDDELISIYRTTRTLLVNELAVRATMAGVPGIVCATNDLPLIKHMRLLTVVPGIRLPGDNINDQVHVGTGEGADLAVIGRPITQASNPLDAVKRINDFFQQNGEKK
jgi:orotidine-5'-phosphate decarboxylase